MGCGASTFEMDSPPQRGWIRPIVSRSFRAIRKGNSQRGSIETKISSIPQSQPNIVEEKTSIVAPPLPETRKLSGSVILDGEIANEGIHDHENRGTSFESLSFNVYCMDLLEENNIDYVPHEPFKGSISIGIDDIGQGQKTNTNDDSINLNEVLLKESLKKRIKAIMSKTIVRCKEANNSFSFIQT